MGSLTDLAMPAAEDEATTVAPMSNPVTDTDAYKMAADLGLLPWGNREIAKFTAEPENTVRQRRFYKSRTNPERDWPKADYVVGSEGLELYAERTVLLHLYRHGLTTREPLPAKQRRAARAKLKRWGLLDEES